MSNEKARSIVTAGDGAASLERLAARGFERLARQDPLLHGLLCREATRQHESLAMIAASSVADPSVLVAEGTPVTNVTVEGYRGARLHAGCEVVDEIERLAIERACAAFGAQYANVQPHSGSSANAIVICSLLRPGDTVLGMDVAVGGHFTHGSPTSLPGRYFNAVQYGVDDSGRLDYEAIERLAVAHRPKLIICGASSYPRTIDFARFREIADGVDAYLLADVSHIAGLIVGAAHPNPIDFAHFTTTSTYKQLYGPHGGLILSGRDHDAPAPDDDGTLAELIQRGVFPFFQGTPDLSAVAAKARALDRAATPEFRALTRLIVDDARALAGALAERGFQVVTGGTDNHMVLIDVVASRGVSGLVAEQALEACNVIVNRCRIAGDSKDPDVTGGLRLGTNTLALRGLGPGEMPGCAELIDRVLASITVRGDRDYDLEPGLCATLRDEIRGLCTRFPLPGYPSA